MADFRDFRIEALYDFTGWNPSALNHNQPLFIAWFVHPYGDPNAEEFSPILFSVHHNVSGALTVVVRPNGQVFQQVVVPTTGNVEFVIEGRISTINGTSGSYTADADGFFKVTINDTTVYDSGLITFWYNDSDVPSTGPYPYWNLLEVGLHGRVGPWKVYVDDVLIHEEDWSSYGSDINAVSNNVGPDYGRYVYWDGIGSNLAGHSTTVSQTGGPNGGPGIVELDTSAGFIAENIVPTSSPPPPPSEPSDPDTQTCPCVEGTSDQTTPEPPSEFLNPIIGPQLLCEGGGLVPDGPDPVWAETWWGV